MVNAAVFYSYGAIMRNINSIKHIYNKMNETKKDFIHNQFKNVHKTLEL